MKVTPEFLQNVREWMARTNTTQQELSLAANLNPACISRMMRGGVTSIRDKTVDAIAAVMGRTVQELHHVAWGEAQSKDDPLADAFNFIRSRPETHDLLYALLKGVGWKGLTEDIRGQKSVTKTR